MKNNEKRSGKRPFIFGAAAVLLALIVYAGVSPSEDQLLSELPDHIDSFEAVVIEDEQVPLADQNVKVTKKTTKKTVKLKSKAKQTYKVDLPVEETTKTAVKTDKTYEIETVTTVKKEVQEQFKKNKKKKTVVTKTTTTVVTTKAKLADIAAAKAAEEAAAKAAEEAAAKAAEEEAAKAAQEAAEAEAALAAEQAEEPVAAEETGTSIRSAASKASDNVLSAFEIMGFKLDVDASYAYSGFFSAKDRCIVLKKNNDNVYHELGHFVAFVAGNADTSSAFKSIYEEEKELYDGRNATYVLADSSEYFAESYREFVLDKSALESKRPKTYEAISNAVSGITEAKASKLLNVYATIWG